MSSRIEIAPKEIKVDGFNKNRNRSGENFSSIGNNGINPWVRFEGNYGGIGMKGRYIGRTCHSDKNRPGGGKNGYADYNAQIPDSASRTGIDTYIDGKIRFSPAMPPKREPLSFRIKFRESPLKGRRTDALTVIPFIKSVSQVLP